jgi:hypothetical protein
MRFTRPSPCLSFTLPLLFTALTCGALAATITVTTTADSGAGSLRQAITDSNASPGVVDTIAFNITGPACAGVPAVCTIKPATALPTVADPVIIDGYTQPGSSPNTLAIGDDAVLLVELDGSLVSPNGIGFYVLANSTVIQGLVINRFSYTGIFIDATGGGTLGGHTIRGNFIGTDPSGTLAVGCKTQGIFLRAPNSNIGGPNPGDRNVISANGASTSFGANVKLEGDFAPVSGSALKGNYIGTNAAGTGALGGGAGILLYPGSEVAIGGSAAGQGNLISGNGDYGISMTYDCVTALANNVIQGNRIGVDASGTNPLGNVQGGIYLGCPSQNNQIGGTSVGAGNTIAHNGAPGSSVGAGVYLESTAGTGNQIRANLIFSNKSLGIALGSDSPLPNDPGDGDTGPNQLQNFPIILSAVPGAGNTHITGKFNSTPSTTFQMDFYANAACSNFPREFLGGETYLGASPVTTDGSGHATIDVTLPVATEAGARISATATDPAGNTSEFSQRIVFAMTGAASGPASGGTAIGVSGTDFANPTTMSIGGVSTPATFVNDHTLQSTSPALGPGTVNDLIATTPDGTSGTLVKAWVSDFLDVPGSQQFHSFVTTLVSNAITVGVGAGNYGVDLPTLRQQMAVFLLKAKHGLCYTPPACTPGVFADVACPSIYANWIEALAAEGITGGCGSGNYCPTTPVRRDQMAVFLLKAEHGSGYLPPNCAGVFLDVPCPGTFANWIEQLAAENITGGCGGNNYCPGNPNTRGQMAVFITKTFNLQ